MIIGTAGHIDHGKTALVRALTGVDTDRLPEEKRRGITIDLGFAPLALPGGRACGVVDVPGHEAFVRTMLAGATGIDVALLVVAADEGVMPQTREHLAILRLLAIPHGVIALTKADLVDEEWLALVRDDVALLVAGSPLAGAEIIATSAPTGQGIDELRDAIGRLADRARAHEQSDLFRLPIDRAFTVRGTGTVVTGTSWSGTIERDATVRVLPGTAVARVRGIESHGSSVSRALPGTRVAIALAGLDHSMVARGQVAVTDAAWHETRSLRADASLLDDAPSPVRPRSRLRLHLGTAEVGARVVAVGGALAPSELRPVRLVLDAPIIARAGDRFVLRSGTPVATIGGGIVTDPFPPHRRSRPWPDVGASPDQRFGWMLEEAAADGLALAELPIRLGLPSAATDDFVAARSDASVRLGSRVYASAALDRVERELLARVRAWHAENPLDDGASVQAIRAIAFARPELVDAALAACLQGGSLELRGALVREPEWAPRLSAAQEATSAAILGELRRAGAEPPSVSELAATHAQATLSSLLRILQRQGLVVAVESDRYYAIEALDALTGTLRAGMERGRVYSPAELRELLGLSRKFLIPFLEFCDRQGVTERRETGRVLHGM